MEYRYDPFWSLVPSLLVGCYVPRSALENGRVAIQVLYRGYSNYCILVFGTDTSYKLKWFWFLRTKTTGMIPWRRLRSQYPEPSQKFLGIATLNSLPVPVYAVPDNYYFYNLLLMVCGAQNKHSSWAIYFSTWTGWSCTKMFVYIWLDISPDLIVGSCILFV